MKKKFFALLVAASMAVSPVAAYVTAAPVAAAENTSGTALVKASATKTMYRLYNDNSGEHFYTSNQGERDELALKGWIYEGVAWIAPASSSTPVYRLYNPVAGDHHYTTSAGERDELVNKYHWNYEGIGWYSGGSVPVYREYNPNARTGTHNYTVSKGENDELVRKGWRAEGIGWYAQSDGKEPAPVVSTINVDIGGGRTQTVYGFYHDDLAKDIEKQINEYRASLGRSQLTSDSSLESFAHVRAPELAVNYSHTKPNGQQVAQTYGIGEIIAEEEGTISSNLFMFGWKFSNPHRLNMIDPNWSKFGVSVFEASNGNVYAVTNFS